jgi:aspartyl-tRNA(Asn)/glutamyl-tRNA(Gln) amidotransferase subunit B
MRSKEDAQDYRYFPDPDLPPLAIDDAWIERVRADLPELPELRKLRFSANSPEHLVELVKAGSGVDLSEVSGDVFEESSPSLQASTLKPAHGLPVADAAALVASRALADYFESVVASGADPRTAARWLLGEVSAALNRSEQEIDAAPVAPAALARLLARIGDGTISGKQAKDVFDAMWAGEAGGDDAADRIIAARGLKQISDEGALGKLVDDVIAAHPAIVAEFRAGKEKAFNALVGKAMAASKGQANPAQLNALLKRKLG